MSGWTSLIGPLVSGAASIYGAYSANQAGRTQANAANNAAQAQQGATQQQLNLLQQMYSQGRDDLAPYRQAGQQGLNLYAQQVAQPFQATPGYQFAYDEAMRGVTQNQAARGLVNSGSTLRALQDRATGLANQEYGQYANRLAALVGIGQTAAGQGVQAGQGYGGQGAGVIGQGVNAANNFMTAGAGATAGGMNQGANALMGGANNLLAYYMQNQNQNQAPAKPGQGW